MPAIETEGFQITECWTGFWTLIEWTTTCSMFQYGKLSIVKRKYMICRKESVWFRQIPLRVMLTYEDKEERK